MARVLAKGASGVLFNRSCSVVLGTSVYAFRYLIYKKQAEVYSFMWCNIRNLSALSALLAIAMVAGCGGGGGGGGSKSGAAPTITSVSATSPSSSAGGTITITASVTDDSGLKSVTAVVTNPSGTASPALGMTAGTGSTYSCSSYVAAENYETSAVTYTVVVTAKDTDGNTSTSTCTFKVPGDAPPAPPSMN